MTQKDKNKEVDFDFYGKEAENQRQEIKEQKEIQYNKFLNIGKKAMLSLGLATVLIGGSYGGYKVHESNVNSKIATVEQTVKATPQTSLVNFINKERGVAQKTYIENQMLINDHGRYKDVIEVLHLENQLSVRNANNAKLYKETLGSLDRDVSALGKVYDTLNASRDQKIMNFLDGGSDLTKLNEWNNNLKSNQFMYVGGLINLNHQLSENLTMLSQTQKDIIQHVQERIKNKDFDLNAAQEHFSKQVQTDAQSEIAELKQIRKDVVATGDLAGEDSDGNLLQADPKLQSLLTDEDVSNAEGAMTVYQKEALSQINQDKDKVQQLLAKAAADNGQSTQANQPAQSGQVNNMSNGQAPTTVVVNRGPSFFDYYMMYSWMNATHPTSTVVHNTYVSPNTYRPVTPLAQTNMYDIKNQNSYLNKTLAQSPAVSANSNLNSSVSKFGNSATPNVAKPNLNAVRAQIDTARAKAAQAQSVRSSEIGRMKAANSYEGGKSFASKAQMAKSGMGSIGKGGSFSKGPGFSGVHSSFSGGHSGGFGGHSSSSGG
jgi:hypothetical protein